MKKNLYFESKRKSNLTVYLSRVWNSIVQKHIDVKIKPTNLFSICKASITKNQERKCLS